MFKEKELKVISTPYWHKFSDRIDSISNAILNNEQVPLQRIAFYLTTNCNVNCEKCTIVDKFPSNTASLDFVVDTVSQGKTLGLEVVHLTGGEVTTIANIEEYVKAIRGLGVEVTMTTNGLSSNKTAKKLMNAGVNQIFLTIDPEDKYEKSAINRRNKAISFAEALIQNKSSEDFSLFIYSLLMNRTYKHFPQHINDIYTKLFPGISGIYPILIKHFPQVRNLVLEREELLIYKNEILPEIGLILKKFYPDEELNNISTYLLCESIVGYSSFELDLYAKGIFPGKLSAPCYISTSQITVSSTGCVFRCLTHHRNTNQPILGNLKNESLSSIIKDKLNPEIFVKNVPLIPECLTICNPGYGFFNYQVYEKLKNSKCLKFLPNSCSFNQNAIKKLKELNCIETAKEYLITRNAEWALKNF